MKPALRGQLCPVGRDGRHKLKVWQSTDLKRSGFACVLCSKTWEWFADRLEPTYGEEP